MAKAIRNHQVSWEAVAETYADPRDPYTDIERALDGGSAEDRAWAHRAVETEAFLAALPERTGDALRQLLAEGDALAPVALARRIGIRRETLYKNLRRASRKVWGTDRPPFARGGSECA